MFVHRDTHAVVFNGHTRIGVNRDLHPIATSRQRLVHRVVDDLMDEMVKRLNVRPADIHARAPADCLKSLQDLNSIGTVFHVFTNDVFRFTH
jgi:hypothetical protein